MPQLPLFPDAASTTAHAIDLIYFALVGMSVFFAGGICIFLVFFAIRYREKAIVNRTMSKKGVTQLEVAWTVIPFGICMVFFVWAGKTYFDGKTPPQGAMNLYVVGHQWMWKIQHPEGNREINELHIPVNRPVRLTMTSEDVIHSFYVPAFRAKQDVLPGRYTEEWFTPTKVGQYHLFCAEYCGTLHSGMVGTVYVMEQADYNKWLTGRVSAAPMAAAGAQLFNQFGCVHCHVDEAPAKAPMLHGLYGKPQKMLDNQTIIVDGNYLQDCILYPNTRRVAGYKDIMPNFQNQISPEQVGQLVEYIKSLADSTLQRSVRK